MLMRFGILMLIVASTLTACTSKYGQLRHNAEVQQAFESNQVPRDYQYFHFALSPMRFARCQLLDG